MSFIKECEQQVGGKLRRQGNKEGNENYEGGVSQPGIDVIRKGASNGDFFW